MGLPQKRGGLSAGPTLCFPVLRVSRRRVLPVRGPGGRRPTHGSSSAVLGGPRGGCNGGP
eukprot:9269869-Lingulodinium_polyedra.AAC.1